MVSRAVLEPYLSLEQPEDVNFVTYVWVDGTLENLRTKTRALDFVPKRPEDCPEWTFCGKGTYQYADIGPKSELLLAPKSLFKDPFLKGNNRIVLCDVYDFERNPIETNTRFSCAATMEAAADEEPWFGLEQEYFLLDNEGHLLGWPRNGIIGPISPYFPYFLGVGSDKIIGREIPEAHLKACAYAGVKIGGYNSEAYLGQWEYQVGPCPGVSFGDHVWMARFLLQRIAEDFRVRISFEPKPIKLPGEWIGSGGHLNFSTKKMRSDGGIQAILEAIKKLEAKSEYHIERYDPRKDGTGNKLRLQGGFCTPSATQFKSDLCSREVSIRIPRIVCDAGKGYAEDRRPGANVEPYRASEALVSTICL